jgi:hypothetical protein
VNKDISKFLRCALDNILMTVIIMRGFMKRFIIVGSGVFCLSLRGSHREPKQSKGRCSAILGDCHVCQTRHTNGGWPTRNDKRAYFFSFLTLLFPLILIAQNNYVFGPSIRVSDDPPGSCDRNISSAGQHGIACQGDTLYVVWYDWRNGYGAVYFSKSTDAGQTWSLDLRFAGGSSDFEAYAPSIALNAGGDIYVAWSSWEPGPEPDRNIYFSKSTDGGLTFSDSVLVNDTTRASQNVPSIAVDSSGQKVFIAWEDKRNPPPDNSDIYCARSTDGGATFLTEVRVDDTGSDSSWQQMPSIGCTRSGDTVYVAWYDGRHGNTTQYDIYFSRSIDQGQTFEPNIIVNDTAGMAPSSQRDPSLWVSNFGFVYIVWQDGREEHYHIFFDKSTDGGLSFDLDVQVSDDSVPSVDPSVAVDDSERVYVAWQDARNFYSTGYDIYFSFSSDSGSTFSSDVQVNDLLGVIDAWDQNANVCVNNTGKVFVAWDTDRNHTGGDYEDIYCASGTYVGIQEYCEPLPSIFLECYPNPFKQITVIRLRRAQSNRWRITDNGLQMVADRLQLKVYDATGHLVKDFSQLLSDIGYRSSVIWDGTDNNGQTVSAGVYIIQLEASDFKETEKVILLK